MKDKEALAAAIVAKLDELDRGSPVIDQIIAHFGQPAFDEFRRQHRADLLAIVDVAPEDLPAAFVELAERRHIAAVQFVVAQQALRN